ALSTPLKALKLCSRVGALPFCTGRPSAPGTLCAAFVLPKWLGAELAVCDTAFAVFCTPSCRDWPASLPLAVWYDTPDAPAEALDPLAKAAPVAKALTNNAIIVSKEKRVTLKLLFFIRKSP